MSTAKSKKSGFGPLGCFVSFIGALLLLLVLLLTIAIWGADRIVVKVAQYVVEDKTDFTITFDKSYVSVFSGDARFNGIVISNPASYPEPGFVTIKEIGASIAPMTLMQDELYAREIVADVENVTWVRTASDTNNISEFSDGFKGEEKAEEAKPAAPEKEKKEFKFFVKSLKVRLGSVRIADYSKGTPADVKELNINYSREFTDVRSVDEIRNALLADFTKIGVGFLIQSTMQDIITAPLDVLTKPQELPQKLLDLGKGAGDTTKDIGESIGQGLQNIFGGLKDSKE